MSTTVQSPAASPRLTPRAWGTLFVLCGAIFLEGINVAMLNVALPAIRADLGLSTGELQWVISAYVLGYGGFMLVGGRAADLYGRRRMFLVWLAVFLVVSALGGMAGEGWTLIAARFVAGVAAAVMTPAGLSIITTSFAEGRQRNQALLVYSGTAAGGFSLGLVLGGLLAAVNWRLVLFAPAVLALIILLLAVPLIPATPEERPRDRRVDVLGAVTVTAAIMLLVLGVERGAHAGAGTTVAIIAAGLALIALFVVIERRSSAPLLRLGLLRSGPLVRANLAGLLFAGAFFGFQFIAVLYLQELRGWSSLQTSLAMLAVGADAVLAPTLTPRLVNRFGNAKVIVAGLLLAVLSYVLFLPIGMDTVYLAMFPTMIVLGVAFALAYGPLTIVATDGVEESEQGVAGALLYTSFQFGAALGLAASTAVIVAVTAGDGGAAGLLDGYRAALAVPIAAAVLAAAISASGLRPVRNMS
ncbi:MFS transporter [Nonomuraea wenchangensis]|uniref:Major Facilitator Superfamily protein n=2 Tax=Nonomuraea wenchangensis TaxID=568860 RepID=A0A1I0L741_9ACTN|nr:MFS transporter [Nonomuraea wenchangensis]SEU34963.1 Major Facilitator Superfamily protein [Nonomuraea wenchangensis]